MKKILIILTLLFLQIEAKSAVPDFYISTVINGTGNIQLNDLCSTSDIEIHVLLPWSSGLLHCPTTPADPWTYSVRLFKGIDEIERIEKTNNDWDMGCSVDLNADFSLNAILGNGDKNGNYSVNIVICHEFIGICSSPVTYSSQVISINITDQYHLGFGTEGDNAGSDDDIVETVIAGNELLVVQKTCGIIYKFKSLGFGDNMMGIACNVEVDNLPGSVYLIGVMEFGQPIGDVVYTADGYTLVGLEDGRIAKITGTGGTGHNMFGIQYDPNGFASVPGYNYLKGSHKFMSAVTDIMNDPKFTLFSFANGNVLKVFGSAGGGTNFCNIYENSTGIFNNVGGIYWKGTDHFTYGHVVKMYPTNSNTTFIAFSDGKLLHVNGTGGGGTSLFAVTESQYNFTNINGYSYYIGDAYFTAQVSALQQVFSDLILGCRNGKILKAKGLGAGGNNMFNIMETAAGFIDGGGAGSHPFKGSAMYPEFLTVIYPENTLETSLGFRNGHFMVITGSGGGGQDFMNATYVSNGFQRSSLAFPNNIIGSANFNTGVSDITYFDNYKYISFANRKMLKLAFTGGGFNMYAVVQTTEGFRPLCGYDYCVGSQHLCSCSGHPRIMAEETSESVVDLNGNELAVFPNPSNGYINISLKLENENVVAINILDISGKVIKNVMPNTALTKGVHSNYHDMSGLENGVYLVSARLSNGIKLNKRIVIVN